MKKIPFRDAIPGVVYRIVSGKSIYMGKGDLVSVDFDGTINNWTSTAWSIPSCSLSRKDASKLKIEAVPGCRVESYACGKAIAWSALG